MAGAHPRQSGDSLISKAFEVGFANGYHRCWHFFSCKKNHDCVQQIKHHTQLAFSLKIISRVFHRNEVCWSVTTTSFFSSWPIRGNGRIGNYYIAFLKPGQSTKSSGSSLSRPRLFWNDWDNLDNYINHARFSKIPVTWRSRHQIFRSKSKKQKHSSSLRNQYSLFSWRIVFIILSSKLLKLRKRQQLYGLKNYGDFRETSLRGSRLKLPFPKLPFPSLFKNNGFLAGVSLPPSSRFSRA